jgi:ABC-type proline/glycine betaine transport system substrate-binding protein
MSHLRRTLALTAIATIGLAASATAAGAPTITSLKATQKANKVTVTITTKNFKIDTKNVGKTPKANRGHEHFAMDGGKFDFPKYSGANGTLAKQLGVQGKYSPSVNNKVVYTGLPKGKHTVTVYLVRNSHANYPNAGAKKKLTFTVR